MIQLRCPRSGSSWLSLMRQSVPGAWACASGIANRSSEVIARSDLIWFFMADAYFYSANKYKHSSKERIHSSDVLASSYWILLELSVCLKPRSKNANAVDAECSTHIDNFGDRFKVQGGVAFDK